MDPRGRRTVLSAQMRWRIAVSESALDPTTKLVALALDTWMDKNGRCWPSKETVRTRTGLGKRTIDRAIDRLKEAGYLDVTRSRGRHANHYRARIPGESAAVEDRVNHVTSDTVAETPTVSLTTANRVTDDTPTVSLRHPKPSEKPPPNPSLTAEISPSAHGWIDDLFSYTGCRLVRGSHAAQEVRDPLGKDPPPSDWPHPRPTIQEIRKALAEVGDDP